jgi:restriction system protein
MSDETTVWVVRAGPNGEADELFLKKNVVALNWPEVPDASTFTDIREGIKETLRSANPTLSPPSVASLAGQLYRFVSEVREGDVVLYPSKIDRHIHLGRIAGPYVFDVSAGDSYAHQRCVEWKRKVPRTDFSQGALYEIGAFMTLFQVRTYAQEFLTAIEGTTAPAIPPAKDPSIEPILATTAESSRDFVRKILARELKGHPLTYFVAHLLSLMGYRTEVSKPGPDGGLDILAYRDELRIQPPIVRVQVKSSDEPVGIEPVQRLQGILASSGEVGLFVTLGTFTAAARRYADGKSTIRLVDGERLIDLVLAHYEELAPYYKGLIPLKRVYVPKPAGGIDSSDG